MSQGQTTRQMREGWTYIDPIAVLEELAGVVKNPKQEPKYDPETDSPW